jgi:hypothetical protein
LLHRVHIAAYALNVAAAIASATAKKTHPTDDNGSQFGVLPHSLPRAVYPQVVHGLLHGFARFYSRLFVFVRVCSYFSAVEILG